ncbi:hypothetical protein JTB14_016962 [Gonioctena quinquepunctata]|nr:hypothetical protein JTB14_016962 [Gonioctena quinquepunctata]
MEKGETVLPILGVRHVQIGLMLLLLTIGYGMRVQLSVAIVAMTDNSTTPNPDIPTYDWDNKSVILSSFYWGYVMLQVIAAELGRKYGPKKFLLGAMATNSTAIMLIPLMAEELGSYGVMGCRIVMGLAQGFFYASVQNVLSKWTPSTESARLGTLAYSGAPLGTIISMALVGYISSTWLGWPFTSYLYGSLGVFWTVLYYIFGSNSPREHGSISEAERKYIEKNQDVDGATNVKTPWKSLATSLPVWTILLVQIGCVWGNTTLLTQIPIYLNAVMKFDMASNGTLSAAPYLTGFLLTFVFAYIADHVMNHNYLSRTWTRRVASAISTFFPAIALIVLAYLPDDASNLSVVMLVAAVGMQTAANSGYMVNNYDLSPNFAGVIMGICNGFGNFVSIFGTITVQFIVTDETNKSQWRIIFLMSALMYTIPGIFFLLFGSGEIQSWDSPDGGKAKEGREDRRKKISVISILSM